MQTDDIGGTVASVKIAAEGKLFEAGSSITEGLDRLFKMYWIFNMKYPDQSINIFKFFECCVYKMKSGNKLPASVRELCSYMSKYWTA